MSVKIAPAEPSSEQKRANRQSILAAGTRVFLRLGYAAASMDEIAAEAGVAKQTVYNHFAGKEALFRAIIDDLTGELTAVLPQTPQAAGPAEALTGFGRRFVEMALAPASLGLHRMLVAEAPRFPDLARAVFEAGPERAAARLADWFAEQDRNGALRVPDPALAAEQFIGALRGNLQLRALFMAQRRPDRRRLDAAVAHAVAMALRAYAAVP